MAPASDATGRTLQFFVIGLGIGDDDSLTVEKNFHDRPRLAAALADSRISSSLGLCRARFRQAMAFTHRTSDGSGAPRIMPRGALIPQIAQVSRSIFAIDGASGFFFFAITVFSGGGEARRAVTLRRRIVLASCPCAAK
jgi:hypothetical protein